MLNLLLAQAEDTFGIGSIEAGTPVTGGDLIASGLVEAPQSVVWVQILNVVFGLLVAAAILAYVVFWVIALVQAIRRTDLKHDKIIWILVLLLVGPLGMILYFFMEDRKKYGIITIILTLIPLVILPLFAIVQFIAARSM